MKRIKVLIAALAITTLTTFPAFAEWKQEGDGRWWYQNEDGSYPANQWMEIDGKQYYFDAGGYMLTNATTPDGKQVGEDGVLISKENFANITYTSDSITNDLKIIDYICETSYYSTHILEITNNSPYTLMLDLNETAKDKSGNIIGASSANEHAIPSGATIFMENLFSNVKGISSFDTSIQAREEKYFTPVIQNIKVESVNLNNKVVVSATNNGDISAKFVEATILFMRNGKPINYKTTFLTDGDNEIKPGATVSEQVSGPYNEMYNNVIVYITGRGRVN